MEKRPGTQERASKLDRAKTEKTQQQTKRMRKMTEYGRQLQEKQKVKQLYGMKEAQFKRFFADAVRSQASDRRKSFEYA